MWEGYEIMGVYEFWEPPKTTIWEAPKKFGRLPKV